MKQFPFLAGLILAGLQLSCIQKEEPNSEADILKCILPASVQEYDETNYYEPFDPTVNAYPLYVSVSPQTDLTNLAPEFKLTPGATIVPASGSAHDFSQPVRYTVTSEDGKWHRTYAVTVSNNLQVLPTEFHLDEISPKSNKYHILYEENKDKGTFMEWGSGNQGFSLVASGASAADYPTAMAGQGVKGNCAKLVTRSTGALGGLVDAPLAAGNLFIGSFSISDALNKPLEATRFGATFHKKPLRLKGYYKYRAGETYYDGKTPVSGKKDNFILYGIFYRKDEGLKTMNGYLAINGFDDPHMVALALMPESDRKETDEWTAFDIAFDYSRYGQSIDADALAKGEYNLGIVASSSKDGDRFKGAIGSTLYVDELEVVCE